MSTSSDGSEARRSGAAPAEWAGFNWNDSSWELMRGLDVVEDLPLDVWPQAAALFQPSES